MSNVFAMNETVIESHPDNALDDLRLDRPFKEFKDLCDGIDLEKMTVKEHSHIPWLIIVYKYLRIWMNTVSCLTTERS